MVDGLHFQSNVRRPILGPVFDRGWSSSLPIGCVLTVKAGDPSTVLERDRHEPHSDLACVEGNPAVVAPAVLQP